MAAPQHPNVSLQIIVEAEDHIYLTFRANAGDTHFGTVVFTLGREGQAPVFQVIRQQGMLIFMDENSDQIFVSVNLNQREIILQSEFETATMSDVPDVIIRALDAHCANLNDNFTKDDDEFRAAVYDEFTRMEINPLPGIQLPRINMRDNVLPQLRGGSAELSSHNRRLLLEHRSRGQQKISKKTSKSKKQSRRRRKSRCATRLSRRRAGRKV